MKDVGTKTIGWMHYRATVAKTAVRQVRTIGCRERVQPRLGTYDDMEVNCATRPRVVESATMKIPVVGRDGRRATFVARSYWLLNSCRSTCEGPLSPTTQIAHDAIAMRAR
jgi:hypothetical protein